MEQVRQWIPVQVRAMFKVQDLFDFVWFFFYLLESIKTIKQSDNWNAVVFS